MAYSPTPDPSGATSHPSAHAQRSRDEFWKRRALRLRAMVISKLEIRHRDQTTRQRSLRSPPRRSPHRDRQRLELPARRILVERPSLRENDDRVFGHAVQTIREARRRAACRNLSERAAHSRERRTGQRTGLRKHARRRTAPARWRNVA